MGRKTFAVISTFLNLLIYFSAGVAAPFFFRNISDRKQAAFLAGGLFSLTALRALRLSISRPYHERVKQFFAGLLFLEFLFWVWRILDTTPLSERTLFGLPLVFIHPGMSALYFISCGVLIYSEWKWLKKSHIF